MRGVIIKDRREGRRQRRDNTRRWKKERHSRTRMRARKFTSFFLFSCGIKTVHFFCLPYFSSQPLLAVSIFSCLSLVMMMISSSVTSRPPPLSFFFALSSLFVCLMTRGMNQGQQKREEAENERRDERQEKRMSRRKKGKNGRNPNPIKGEKKKRKGRVHTTQHTHRLSYTSTERTT